MVGRESFQTYRRLPLAKLLALAAALGIAGDWARRCTLPA